MQALIINRQAMPLWLLFQDKLLQQAARPLAAPVDVGDWVSFCFCSQFIHSVPPLSLCHSCMLPPAACSKCQLPSSMHATWRVLEHPCVRGRLGVCIESSVTSSFSCKDADIHACHCAWFDSGRGKAQETETGRFCTHIARPHWCEAPFLQQ